ncbi:MAG: hypothetical protein ACI4KM_06350 [Oscillospiraceae bacterium]
MNTYTLKQIISQCLKEIIATRGLMDEENISRNLSRYFDTFLKSIGIISDYIKNQKRQYEITEENAPFVKSLLISMYLSDNIAKFIRMNKNDHGIIKTDKFHDYVQLLIDEIDKKGDFTEEQIKNFVSGISNIYRAFPLSIIDSCHVLLDNIKNTFASLTFNQQFEYSYTLYNILKSEFAHRFVNQAIDIRMISEILDNNMDQYNKEDVLKYTECDYLSDELRLEYVERDSHIIALIQEDVLLREYIEKSLGKKAEEIFCYDSN